MLENITWPTWKAANHNLVLCAVYDQVYLKLTVQGLHDLGKNVTDFSDKK